MTDQELMVPSEEPTLEQIEEASATARFERVKWIVNEIRIANVGDAVNEKKLESGTVEFVESVAWLLMAITNDHEDVFKVTPLILARMEDAYIWSLPTSRLTGEQKKRVAQWCRDSGHEKLADDIEKAVESSE